MGENINKVKIRAYGTRLIANFNDGKHRRKYGMEKRWLTVLSLTNGSTSIPQRMNPESRMPFERKTPARQKYSEANAQ